MKPTLEQLEAVFGKAPEPPKGCRWEVERIDSYPNNWVEDDNSMYGHAASYCPEFNLIAIRVFREDGTPLDIDPLPEVEGYRVEYATGKDIREKGYNAEPPKKPTMLEDLVGEDGQKKFYLICENGFIESGNFERDCGQLLIGASKIEDLIRYGNRWSHSPHTKYEDANEFVVEGGSSNG